MEKLIEYYKSFITHYQNKNLKNQDITLKGYQ